MTAVPARVAGVPEVVLCVPPDRDGRVPPEVLAAAALAGVDEVYRIGGAQAVAAMAYGTATVAPVDVIVGPGNVYVALAKQQVAGVVGIPASFAGPSEVVVVADASAPAAWAAVDVVVQAEHGPGGLAWLVTWDEAVADAVSREVDRLVAESPRRAEIESTLRDGGYAVLCDGPEQAMAVADAVSREVDRLVAESPRRAEIESTLRDGGYAVLCDGPEQAMAVANAIAPEHLELIVEDPEALLPLVRHAGAVFLGPYAPASVGDYVAGPSHVLPTFGSARFAGALRVDDFRRHIHVVALDGPTLAKVAPHVAAIAEAEGLAAHALSVRLREEP
jgi:histidinol dehydrogenase